MTQEELQLVLEALKWCHGGEPCGTAEAITVVEKALANVATNDTPKERVDEIQKQRHEQEPVALQDDEIYDAAFSAYCRGENSRELFRIMWSNRLTCSIGWDRDELKSFARNIAALYTTPPQRSESSGKPSAWAGLTNKDITQVINLMPKKMKGFMVDWDLYELAQTIEAKLKEKNT